VGSDKKEFSSDHYTIDYDIIKKDEVVILYDAIFFHKPSDKFNKT
jgi:hypothetical protein